MSESISDNDTHPLWQGPDCAGAEADGADPDPSGARALTAAMISLLPVACAVCESKGLPGTARTLAELLMDAHRVHARLSRTGS